jgi:hypothetical protein
MTIYPLSPKERELVDLRRRLSVEFACADVLLDLRTVPAISEEHMLSWTHRILPNGEGSSVILCASCTERHERGEPFEESRS